MITHIKENPFVNGCWEISEGYDFLLEIVARSLNNIEQCKEDLRTFGAQSITMTYVLRDIVREHLFCNEQSGSELRMSEFFLRRK